MDHLVSQYNIWYSNILSNIKHAENMRPILQLLVLLLLSVSITAIGYWSTLIAPLEAFSEVDISDSERLVVLNYKTKKETNSQAKLV